MEKKLYAVYLWAKSDRGIIEDHDLVFVVASDADEAEVLAKQMTTIKEKVHCDWTVCIEKVGDYIVHLSKI